MVFRFWSLCFCCVFLLTLRTWHIHQSWLIGSTSTRQKEPLDTPLFYPGSQNNHTDASKINIDTPSSHNLAPKFSFDDATLEMLRQQYEEQQLHFMDMMNSSMPTNDNLPLCKRQDIRHGYWYRVELPKAPYQPIDDGGRRYSTSNCYYSLDLSNHTPWTSYDWIPYNYQKKRCHWTPWNRMKFCKKLREKTVTVVGDSLSFEFYQSLIYMLYGSINTKSMVHSYNRKDYDIIRNVCPASRKTHRPSVKLTYRRDDTLVGGLPSVLELMQPDVLILNRGAHYVSDETLLRDLQQHTIPLLLNYQKTKRCRIFWRTTVPGHPRCWNFTQPVVSKHEMERVIEDTALYRQHHGTEMPIGEGGDQEEPFSSSSSFLRYHFHWFDFRRQNELIERALLESELKVQFLDGYDLMILRPDLHRGRLRQDCLHSCLPGKTDAYAQLLLHYLLSREVLERNTSKL